MVSRLRVLIQTSNCWIQSLQMIMIIVRMYTITQSTLALIYLHMKGRDGERKQVSKPVRVGGKGRVGDRYTDR